MFIQTYNLKIKFVTIKLKVWKKLVRFIAYKKR